MLIAVLAFAAKILLIGNVGIAVSKLWRPKNRQLIRDTWDTAKSKWPEPKPEPLEFTPHNKLAWCEICDGPQIVNPPCDPARYKFQMQQNAGMNPGGWQNYTVMSDGTIIGGYGNTGTVIKPDGDMVSSLSLSTDKLFMRQQSVIRQLREKTEYSQKIKCPGCGSRLDPEPNSPGNHVCHVCCTKWTPETLKAQGACKHHAQTPLGYVCAQCVIEGKSVRHPEFCRTCKGRNTMHAGVCQSNYCRSRGASIQHFDYGDPGR